MKLLNSIGLLLIKAAAAMIFVVLVTPVGLLLRLFNLDFLKRKIEKNGETYWEIIK